MRLAFRIGLFALAGFAAGLFFAHREHAEMLHTPGAHVARQKPASGPSDEKQPFRNVEEATSAILSAHLERDPLRRAFELSEGLRQLNADQAAALVARVLTFPDQQREALLEPLIARWSELDVEAVAKWVEPFIERAFVWGPWRIDEQVAGAWARVAPEEAVAAALRRPDALCSQHLLGEATGVLAESNPRAQIERIAALPPSSLRERALTQALTTWGEKDPAAASAEIEQLAPGRNREDARRQILRSWASKDAAGALTHLQQLIPNSPVELEGNPLVNVVVAAAAHREPELALTWAQSLPEEIRVQATTPALGVWARKAPLAALEWARAKAVPLDMTSQHSEGGFSWNAPITHAMEADSEKVTSWLRALPPGKERAQLIRAALISAPASVARELFGELSSDQQVSVASAVAWQIARHDPQEAVLWARTLEPGSARATAFSSIVGEYRSRLPSKLEGLIADLAGLDRDAALRGYAQNVGFEDSAQALALAAQIADPAMRAQTFQWTASGWLSRDEAAARAWLATTPELSPGMKEVILRSAAESRAADGR